MSEQIDHLVIGGGAYGLTVATTLAETFPNASVVLAEREPELVTRASDNNHGRLHFGYQYPTHGDTAKQSRTNVVRFIDDYPEAVDHSKAYYAIHTDSIVPADVYARFYEQSDLPCERVAKNTLGLFGEDVTTVFETSELTFSSSSLRQLLIARARHAGVETRTGLEVLSVHSGDNEVNVTTKDEQKIRATNVFNCSYSGINDINDKSGLRLLPSKHERYALFKIALPEEIRDISATVIYGAYATIVAQRNGEHVLAHVKHSNCASTSDFEPTGSVSPEELQERYLKTLADAHSYLPIIQDSTYTGEIVQVKSVFGLNPAEGERRVQTFQDYDGLEGYHVVFGGKMNSFYDAGAFAVRATLGTNPRSTIIAV